MKDDTQPEALRIADEFRECLERDAIPSIIDVEKAVAELCRQHARIAELEAHLEYIRAGGVSALMGAAKAGSDGVASLPLPGAQEAVALTCEWTHNDNDNDDDGFWETACGEAWRFDDGGPAENSVHFCHSCGKSLCIKGGQHGAE